MLTWNIRFPGTDVLHLLNVSLIIGIGKRTVFVHRRGWGIRAGFEPAARITITGTTQVLLGIVVHGTDSFGDRIDGIDAKTKILTDLDRVPFANGMIGDVQG